MRENIGLLASIVIVAIIIAAAFAPAVWHTLRRPKKVACVTDQNGVETEDSKLFRMVAVNNECPDCHSHGFYAGPEGPGAQNVFCKNVECRSGFNVMEFGGNVGIAQRIGKQKREWYPASPSEVRISA